MTSVSVIIPVCGDSEWDEIAQRAEASAWDQSHKPDQVLVVRADTVAQARNQGSEMATSDWQIFLDADDTLDHWYVQAMTDACLSENRIYRPCTLGVYEDGTEDAEPVLIPRRNLNTGNFIVIGAMHRRDAFMKAGGFQEYPILEDWDLWLTMVNQGAEVREVPHAIYRVSVRPGSRNADPRHGQVYLQITRKHRNGR